MLLLVMEGAMQLLGQLQRIEPARFVLLSLCGGGVVEK